MTAAGLDSFFEVALRFRAKGDIHGVFSGDFHIIVPSNKNPAQGQGLNVFLISRIDPLVALGAGILYCVESA